MAIVQAVCTTFKTELLEGIHNLATDVFKMALYSESASLGEGTTGYTTTGEITATGYTAGGKVITGQAIATQGTTVYWDFANVEWTNSGIAAAGALVYNTTVGNKAALVLSFGGTQAVINGIFRVVLPAPNSTFALLRL